MSNKGTILVTGGTGYIGSHTVVELVNNGYQVVIVDSLINSKKSVITRLEQITGKTIPLEVLDLRDTDKLDKIFKKYAIGAVIHFAGLKAVGESVSSPLLYYKNNLDSTLSLLEVMNKNNVNILIFSSSATVYGDPKELPITEDAPVGTGLTNPYGKTKYMIEEILNDLYASNKKWNITILRYFNPIGAHSSGLIGEDPSGIPNNLLPYIQQVAIGKRDHLSVFGADYDTLDGTGVRDYIHVVDLSIGHMKALEQKTPGIHIYNLGTGKGTSVMEMIKAFELASKQTIPYKIVDRRPGDIASCYADPSKANTELGWKAINTINDACKDAWRWQKYASKNLD